MQTKLCLLFLFIFCYVSLSAQIVRVENNKVSSDTARWQGLLDLSFALIGNSTDFYRFAVGSQVKYQAKKNTILSLNELKLVIADNNDFENKGYQHFRYQRAMDSTITMELFTQIQFDQVLKINLRQLNGIGPRLQFFRKSNTLAYLGSQYMYEYEEESTGIINRTHRISSYLSLSGYVTPLAIQFITYYQPAISNFGDYRISGSTAVSIAIIKNLLFNIKGELVYDSKPVQGINKRSYSLVNGFSWSF